MTTTQRIQHCKLQRLRCLSWSGHIEQMWTSENNEGRDSGDQKKGNMLAGQHSARHESLPEGEELARLLEEVRTQFGCEDKEDSEQKRFRTE